jgi:hypothetical protein
MISLTLIVIYFLLSCGYAQISNSGGSSQSISNADKLLTDCQKIHYSMLGWTLMLFGSKTANPMEMRDRDYRVYLKPFATRKDTTEILQMSSLKGLVPTTIFDQEKNRGFRANLTLQQFCDVYQHPNVRLTSYVVRRLCVREAKFIG